MASQKQGAVAGLGLGVEFRVWGLGLGVQGKQMHRDVYLAPCTLGMRVFPKNWDSGYGFENPTCGPRAFKIQCEVGSIKETAHDSPP